MKYLVIEPNGRIMGMVESSDGPDSVRKAFREFVNAPEPAEDNDEATGSFFGARGISRVEFEEVVLAHEDMLEKEVLEYCKKHNYSLEFAYEALLSGAGQ